MPFIPNNGVVFGWALSDIGVNISVVYKANVKRLFELQKERKHKSGAFPLTVVKKQINLER